jgi:O-acetyl-ADP-ribose deacetylase (regulator of RNase III)
VTPRIELEIGDITTQAVDAIVNAANTALRPGGGVDGAITRAAGKKALADRERVVAEWGDPPLPTGDAVATTGGDLSARWIIHTAGPIYSGSDRDPELLASCHTSCLRVADELGASSIAFPAISTGIYGYPVAQAAPIAIRAVRGADTKVDLVRFVLFRPADLEVFTAALDA